MFLALDFVPAAFFTSTINSLIPVFFNAEIGNTGQPNSSDNFL